MKLVEAPTKIVGVHLGEASLNFIHEGIAPIKAKFALLAKDGSPIGYVEMSREWSEKTLDALKQLTAALEEEAAARVFEITTGDAEAKAEPSGPRQF